MVLRLHLGPLAAEAMQISDPVVCKFAVDAMEEPAVAIDRFMVDLTSPNKNCPQKTQAVGYVLITDLLQGRWPTLFDASIRLPFCFV